jgi:hypothetical protein
MTKWLTSRKQEAWERPIIGGVLSAATAGFTILVFYLLPNVFTGFFGIMFLVPAYIIESLIAAVTSSSFHLNEAVGIFISVLLWLVAGAMIARYFKSNKSAIGCWFLLYVVSITMAFAIFFLKNRL